MRLGVEVVAVSRCAGPRQAAVLTPDRRGEVYVAQALRLDISYIQALAAASLSLLMSPLGWVALRHGEERGAHYLRLRQARPGRGPGGVFWNTPRP